MHIINTLVPVFLLIGLGFVLRKSNFLSGELVGGINKLVYWIGLPALLFVEIATADFDLGPATGPFVAIITAFAVCVLLGYVVGSFLKVPKRSLGAFVQGTFHGNTVYIGLPVLTFSAAELPVEARPVMHMAVLVLAMIMPIYNIGSVVVLLSGQHKFDKYVPLRIGRRLITNPFIVASVAGLIWSWAEISLPWAINRTLDSAGQMALPLALIATGATITGRAAGVFSRMAFWSSAIKIAVGPVVGYIIGRIMGLDRGQMLIAMVLLAVPAAVSTLVLADQLDSDSDLAADIILISSILSIASLSAVIAIV